MTTDFDRYSMIDLVTVGRVTGNPHVVEVWFAQRDSTLYILSGGRDGSDWVRNLIRTPQVLVRDGTQEYPGLGRIVTDPGEDRVARDAVYEKYVRRYGGDLTDWRATALPVAVDLVSGDEGGSSVSPA